MKEKIKWYCSKCKKFIENPNPISVKSVGITGEISCDICGSWLMKIKERGK